MEEETETLQEPEEKEDIQNLPNTAGPMDTRTHRADGTMDHGRGLQSSGPGGVPVPREEVHPSPHP